MGLFNLFGSSDESDKLDREQSMESAPVLNGLITVEYDDEDKAILHVPRKRTTMVRWMAKLFHIPPYKEIELDELGTYTIELCDGEHTVKELIEMFADEFDLNHREAEVSMVDYLQKLAKRGIIAFVVPENDE
ncbi:MAG: PqqD family protein [Planctomycetota bacterium]